MIVATTVIMLLAPSLLAAAFAVAAGDPGTDPMTIKARAMLSGPGWEGFTPALGQVVATGGLLGMVPVLLTSTMGRNRPTMPSVSIIQLSLVPIVSLAVASATVIWWQTRPLV